MTESMLYRNQYNDLHTKSMEWFLYDSDFCHERVKKHEFKDSLRNVTF